MQSSLQYKIIVIKFNCIKLPRIYSLHTYILSFGKQCASIVSYTPENIVPTTPIKCNHYQTTNADSFITIESELIANYLKFRNNPSSAILSNKRCSSPFLRSNSHTRFQSAQTNKVARAHHIFPLSTLSVASSRRLVLDAIAATDRSMLGQEAQKKRTHTPGKMQQKGRETLCR